MGLGLRFGLCALILTLLNSRVSTEQLRVAPASEVDSLKEEIAANLKSVVLGRGLSVPLRIIRIKGTKNDSFFRIVTTTHQDPDTVASLNRLISPNDFAPGDELLIPNARGLFLETDKEAQRLAAAGNSKNSVIHFVSGSVNMHFIPGRRFHPEERKLFFGEGFLQPLKHFVLTSTFGYRMDPFTRKRTFHGGLDLAAELGSPVRASRAGKVAFAGDAGEYGLLVILDHGHGYQTLYGHLKEISVTTGRYAQSGEVIGKVGSTGLSTGPHLHFEMRKSGKTEKPLIHLKSDGA